jgi:hypothetical protein
VKIDIPALLVRHRERSQRTLPLSKRVGMALWRWCVSSPRRYRLGQ